MVTLVLRGIGADLVKLSEVINGIILATFPDVARAVQDFNPLSATGIQKVNCI
jgi:hypothetical protein